MVVIESVKKIFPVLLIVLLFSCADRLETESPFLVKTTSVIYATSSKVIVQGDLLSLYDATRANDHGFQLSLTEEFENVREISLGDKLGLGRFLAEITELQPAKNYFVRSYAVLGEEKAFGNILSFSSLSPSVNGFSPGTADETELVVIYGSNVPDSIEVYFGDKKAEVRDVLFNTEVKVSVPPSDGSIFVPIRIEFLDTTIVLEEEFEYITGNWSLYDKWPQDFLTANYFETMSFQVGSKLIFGLGYDQRLSSLDSIFTYDMASKEWQKIWFPGNSTRSPFVIGSAFGGGKRSNTNDGPLYNNELWDFNEGAFNYRGVLGFDNYHGVGMKLNGTNYLFGGVKEETNLPPEPTREDRWKPLLPIYKEEGSQFIKLNKNIIGLNSIEQDLPHFVINDTAYFIDRRGQLWSFYEPTFSWEYKSDFPGRDLYEGLFVVLKGKAYVGLSNSSQKLYVYDPVTNEWRRKKPFPARFHGEVLAAGVHDDEIYVIRNPRLIDLQDFPTIARPIEVWKFNPVRY